MAIFLAILAVINLFLNLLFTQNLLISPLHQARLLIHKSRINLYQICPGGEFFHSVFGRVDATHADNRKSLARFFCKIADNFG